MCIGQCRLRTSSSVQEILLDNTVLDPCGSKEGPLTSSTGVTRGLVRKAEFQIPPYILGIRIYVLITSTGAHAHLSLRSTVLDCEPWLHIGITWRRWRGGLQGACCKIEMPGPLPEILT